jgi:hypothetical protein
MASEAIYSLALIVFKVFKDKLGAVNYINESDILVLFKRGTISERNVTPS